MPHAVVVGTDATALTVGGRLAARGFQVTLLEESHSIGGQWVQRLYADNAGCDFNASENGVFLDFPLLPPRANKNSIKGADVFSESVGGVVVQATDSWTEPSKSSVAALAETSTLTPDQQLLSHLADYAHATGLHRHVRLGCTLRRAKWQAMNGCWRLELNNDSMVQRGGQQLSADLLVASRQAVAAVRLPKVPGGELYCGTVLTANDQLLGPAGAAVLDQHLRGRHVLIVGPLGLVTDGWTETCRRYAGCGGSVVVLELLEEGQGGEAQRAGGDRDSGTGAPSWLFSACLGCGNEARGNRRRTGIEERASPAQPAWRGSDRGAAVELLMAPEGHRSGTTRTPEDGEPEAENVDFAPELVKVTRLDKMSTGGMPFADAVAGDCGSGGGGEDNAYDGVEENEHGSDAEKKLAAMAAAAARRVTAHSAKGAKVSGDAGGGGDGGSGAKTRPGRSSLRVIRGVDALLQGTHVMLSTGEELPADVVLLVPLGGVETSLAFLDAGGPPVRTSMAGVSSTGGSFKHAATLSLTAPSASLTSLPETLSCQLDNLYRDILFNSPFAPNLALVGVGARPAQHDARTAALQAEWLLATWIGSEGIMSDGPMGLSRHGGDCGCGGTGGGALDFEPPWATGVPAGGGYLRQASPVEAAADRALRARWLREATKRGRSELYGQRYMQQLLLDLGAPVQAPFRWWRSSPPSEQLSRQRVAKLLGLKRLRHVRPSGEHAFAVALATGASSRNSPPSRAHGLSTNGGSIFEQAMAAAGAAATAPLFDCGSSPASREASHTSCQDTMQMRLRILSSSQMGVGMRERELKHGAGSRCGSHVASMSEISAALHSEGVLPAVAFASHGGLSVSAAAADAPDAMLASYGLAMPQHLMEVFYSTNSMHACDAPLSLRQDYQGHQSQGSNLTDPTPALHTNINIYRDSVDSSSRIHAHLSINPNLNGQYANNTTTNNSSVSFPLGISPQLMSNDLQLYRVSEHPTEYLGEAGPGASMGGGAGSAQSQSQHPWPSCPSSPNLSPVIQVLPSAGSISGALRGRVPTAARGKSFSVAPLVSGSVGSGAGTLASVATSPCVLSAHGDGGCTSTAGVLTGSGPSGEELQPQPHLRSQMLRRYRSTSRLAGVSNASSSGPSGVSQPQSQSLAATASGTLSTLFGRRPPTQQASFNVPQSFLNDMCCSNSGRLGQGGASRRGNHTSYIGGGAGSGLVVGGTGLVSRANSAVRLQLLLAAASSASRRRTVVNLESPTASIVSFDGGGSGGGGGSGYGGGSDAVQTLGPVKDRAIYSSSPSYGGDAVGGTESRASAIGTSIVALARDARTRTGPYGEYGSVSEPVASDLLSAMASAPGSPQQLHGRSECGKETAAGQLSTKSPCGAALMAKDGEEQAKRFSNTGSTSFVTGEQHWEGGEPSAFFQVAAGGLSESGGGSSSMDGSVEKVESSCARPQSITLPNLRYRSGHEQSNAADHYLSEDDDCNNDDGSGDDNSKGAL